MSSNSKENMVRRKTDYSESEDVVLILQTRNQVYVNMVIPALENEKIPALLKSVTGYHLRGMLPFEQGFFDYRLYVTAANEERARQIVETIVPPEEIG
jgi:hypothetical protein